MATHKGHIKKFLLVGCGTIGERHAALAAENGCLTAVCDIEPKRAKAFSKKYQCFGYTSLKEMLQQHADADVLIVCTPNGLHAQHSIAGLEANVHVLCEKPMALHISDCKKMIAVAAKAKRHLLVVKQNRLNTPVAAVKNLLDKKKLGAIYSIQVNCFWNRGASYYKKSNWRGTKALDGGVLFTQFSHFVDLLYWFFGTIKTVKGFKSNRAHQTVTEVEDTGVFSFVTQNGVPGTLHYSTNAARCNYEGSITIIAEKATIKIGGAYLNTIEYQQPAIIPLSKIKAAGKENIYKGYRGSMNNHAGVYQQLMSLLSGKKNEVTHGEEAMHSIAMIEQFYKQASIVS